MTQKANSASDPPPPSAAVMALEQAYREALAKFKADKTNKDLRRARTAAKAAWDEAVFRELTANDPNAVQLTCRDCSQSFVWTGRDQEYYRERHWDHQPQRCPNCASSQKARRTADESTTNSTTPGSKRAGRQMCYAFQRGNCPYGDRCKFNHDPDFAGKSKEEKENEEGADKDKKRKRLPEEIALCKWGKDCKIKRCRYRHEELPKQELPSPNESARKIPNHDAKAKGASATSETPKVLAQICKWGKNCKLKRCRFRHDIDDAFSPVCLPARSEAPTDAKGEVNLTSVTVAAATSVDVPAAPAPPSSATRDQDSKATSKSKTKSSKHSDKHVAKAVTKALKKAPRQTLRIRELRKLVRTKLNAGSPDDALGKDDVKKAVRRAIADHPDSLSLLEDGKTVKLLL